MQLTTLKLLFTTFILLTVGLEVVGDVLFKKWSLGSPQWYFVIGLVLYFFSIFFWALSLRYEMLTKAISVFTVFNFLLSAAAGFIIFKEQLSTINKIGIMLALVSIILLEI